MSGIDFKRWSQSGRVERREFLAMYVGENDFPKNFNTYNMVYTLLHRIYYIPVFTLDEIVPVYVGDIQTALIQQTCNDVTKYIIDGMGCPNPISQVLYEIWSNYNISFWSKKNKTGYSLGLGNLFYPEKKIDPLIF